MRLHFIFCIWCHLCVTKRIFLYHSFRIIVFTNVLSCVSLPYDLGDIRLLASYRLLFISLSRLKYIYLKKNWLHNRDNDSIVLGRDSNIHMYVIGMFQIRFFQSEIRHSMFARTFRRLSLSYWFVSIVNISYLIIVSHFTLLAISFLSFRPTYLLFVCGIF